ncbi:aminoglycoside phosphotransferase family protein [Nostocoides jenkinsii]|uniref:Aminoglycoside/hydroxyurea antibiotic resistance kinase n=1 Tax=Nostocoides jenkinsii Ben 74 TaxID=1193518 RepID=A0A077MGE8_9MICO|nr:aminoglycoside phosphotransferase family protein [Tetrasphaera jenkinsii]CCI54753.1 Aminoglycoside/hydroxyurea antibiotic resistance kinase [Tetrasphaera jenkinsii Ben 74]
MPHPLIPESFRALVAGRAGEPDVTGDDWLRRLPGLIDEHLDRWSATPDGEVRHGEGAIVIPVSLRDNGTRAALKLTWPHAEARHEHLALRHWNGEGAVRLLAADPAAYALLLERLDASRELTSVSILEACEVIGGLFGTLDRPAAPQFDRLSERAERWLPRLDSGHPLVPRRLTAQASTTLGHLLDGAVDGRLVHEDLHDMNVLAPLDPARGAWLAIAPKPVSGEWAYAVAPIVWNHAEASAAAYNLRVHVRLRADIVAEAAGLDPDRVTHWTFVRLVLNALWAAPHSPGSDGFRARMIALAKAFAD